MDPPPSTSSTSSLCAMLDIVMTIQVAHGQLLLDVLNEQIWRMLEVLLHRLHPLMIHDCPLAIHHKKGEYIEMGGGGIVFGFLDCI